MSLTRPEELLYGNQAYNCNMEPGKGSMLNPENHIRSKSQGGEHTSSMDLSGYLCILTEVITATIMLICMFLKYSSDIFMGYYKFVYIWSEE